MPYGARTEKRRSEPAGVRLPHRLDVLLDEAVANLHATADDLDTRACNGTPPRCANGPARPDAGCATVNTRMASPQTLTTPQRLAAIREQLSLLADYL